LRLDARLDVLRYLVRAGVVVHRAANAEVRVGADFDAGDNRFHVPPVVKQGSEGRPALFGHAVALVEDANSARDHGSDERARVVGDLIRGTNDRLDDQVLRTRVRGRLEDVDGLPHSLGGGAG